MIDAVQGLADAWLLFSLNYFIHSTLLIGGVLLAWRLHHLAFDRLGEWTVKSALLLGCLTAALLTGGWLHSGDGPDAAWQVQWAHSPVAQHADAAQMASPVHEALITPAPPAHGPQGDADGHIPQQTWAQTPHSDVRTPVNEVNVFNGAVLWLSLWGLGAGFLLGRHGLRRRRWLRSMRSRTPVTDERITRLFAELLQRSGLPANVRLSQSTALRSPIALHREVVCPAAFLQQHNSAQIEAALAHELAHIKRRDHAWLQTAQWFGLLLFFQPLNRALMQHIRRATEHKADALAAAWTDNPRALAATLVDVAKAHTHSTHEPMVPAMISRKSQLLQRVENILQPKNLKSSRAWPLGLFAALLMLAVGGPGVVAKTRVEHTDGDGAQHHIIRSGGVTEMSLSHTHEDRAMKLKAKLTGEIQFNDAETAIVDFPADSRFDLSLTANGLTQRLQIESAPGANAENAEYTFWSDGDERPFDARARQWFAEAIPQVLRQTGLQAEARVERIQGSRGDAAVLDEVALIDSDFVRKAYLNHLFKLSRLQAQDVQRAMVLAADIDSDFELSHVLSALVDSQNMSSEALWLGYFNSAAGIESDFEMAKTLLNALPQLPHSEAINRAWFNAAESIDSDFEMSKVLIAWLQRNAEQAVNLEHLFALAVHIESDFELAKVLLAANKKMASAHGNNDALFTAYLDLAAHIDSDFEMKKVYADLLKNDLSERHLQRMIEAAAEHIGSDFELASVLLTVVKKQNLNAALKSHIKTAAQSIGSAFERNRVLEAIG